MIGFSSDPRFVNHLTGPQHPERPDRIRAIHKAVRAAGMVDSPDPFPDFALDFGPLDGHGVKLTELQPTRADERWLTAVHTPRHVEHVKHACAVGGGVLDQGDTRVVPESCAVALLALGALLRCCDAVMAGEVRRAFAAVRPPGHHAEPDRAMGFCLFSNVAIAARYLQRQHGLERIAIVDFDVHHGNGTQAAFDTRVLPVLETYRPDALLISAGFDAHPADPLAQIQLSEECYERMTRLLVGVAEKHCAGRVISALEGGYNLRALGRSVVRHLVGLG